MKKEKVGKKADDPRLKRSHFDEGLEFSVFLHVDFSIDCVLE